MFELLRDRVLKELVEPKTLDQLAVILPEHKRTTLRGEVNNLKRHNFLTKIGKTYQLHPAYKRMNNL